MTIHAYIGPLSDIVFTGRADRLDPRGNRIMASVESSAEGRSAGPGDGAAKIFMAGRDRFSSVTVDGRDVNDQSGFSLRFAGTSQVTRYDDRDNPDSQGDRRGNGDGNGMGRGQGRQFTDEERWRNGRQDFVMRYTLTLRSDSGARMVVESIQDRNMPNGRVDRQTHGDILKYLINGQAVNQSGHWTQQGNTVTILFDTIQTGGAPRGRKEKFTGHMGNGTLVMDDWDRTFYGRDVRFSFSAR